MAELATGAIQFCFLRQGSASDLCEGLTVLVFKVDQRRHFTAKSLLNLGPTASRFGQVISGGLSELNDPPLKFHLGPLAGIDSGPIGATNGLALENRTLAPFLIGLEQVVAGAHRRSFREAIQQDGFRVGVGRVGVDRLLGIKGWWPKAGHQEVPLGGLKLALGLNVNGFG